MFTKKSLCMQIQYLSLNDTIARDVYYPKFPRHIQAQIQTKTDKKSDLWCTESGSRQLIILMWIFLMIQLFLGLIPISIVISKLLY